MPVAQIDLGELQDRLAPIEVTGLSPLAGGASSLTFVGLMAPEKPRQIVVKVAPPGLPPVLNRDVLRQSRLLRALLPTDVPVPEVIWEDAGDPPEIPPLFVMTFVEGASFEPLFDPDGGQDETLVAESLRNAARTLAALHALDPDHLGAGAEPPVGPGEEIARWSRLLETIDPALVPGWRDVAASLEAGQPPAPDQAIVHGDFRLGNLLTVGADVAAVVDWEIWSVGDPRVDVGWFLINADPATYRRPSRFSAALPSLDELTEIYTGALGRQLPDLGWFQALACFKSTATWSLIVKHNRRRKAPDPALEDMAATLPDLLEQARRLLA
jgi:aminoglycoside phosphotransferase (APT) family kinase protein